MPSLFKAMGNWFREKKDEAAESIADPVRDGKYAIEDSKERIAKFTADIARLVAETKRLERQRDEARQEVEKFDAIARRAAAQANEGDVRQAVTLKAQATARLGDLESEVDKNIKLTDALRGQLDEARNEIANAESNITRLAARKEGAKIRSELAKSSTEFNAGDSPLASLKNLEKAVDKDETEAEAWEDIAKGQAASKGENLEKKYSASSGAVDDEVARLLDEAKKK